MYKRTLCDFIRFRVTYHQLIRGGELLFSAAIRQRRGESHWKLPNLEDQACWTYESVEVLHFLALKKYREKRDSLADLRLNSLEGVPQEPARAKWLEPLRLRVEVAGYEEADGLH